MKKYTLICSLLFSFLSLFAQEKQIETGVYLYDSISNGTDLLRYRIMYPNGFDKEMKYPMVVFLHGMGERGTNNKTQLSHGSKLFQDSIEKYPAIIIFPQCDPTDYWANLYRPDKGGSSRSFTFYTEKPPNKSLGLTIDLIESMISESFVDDDRIYVSGLSMGGMGIWELLWRIPEKIAAAAPICGGGPREMADKMTEIPIWAFHGAADGVVHYRYSVMMIKAVQQAGGRAKISLYPGVNHNSWDYAFAEPKYLQWMFSKSKK